MLIGTRSVPTPGRSAAERFRRWLFWRWSGDAYTDRSGRRLSDSTHDPTNAGLAFTTPRVRAADPRARRHRNRGRGGGTSHLHHVDCSPAANGDGARALGRPENDYGDWSASIASTL
jgi:hypothetical protein